ncbi:Uncharacterised protein [Dermatophilus congolensis]|uniref:Uncharacterized protein n=1 Tax=Dermatophilus congolensis TaxID=1863 RepID=A0A239VJB6_9MICO|nr:Uncharacterised protein [Dermatophilus congolensis]
MHDRRDLTIQVPRGDRLHATAEPARQEPKRMMSAHKSPVPAMLTARARIPVTERAIKRQDHP